jgi:hypothetical protein
MPITFPLRRGLRLVIDSSKVKRDEPNENTVLREGPMKNQLIYRWQAAYLSAILEFDPSKISAKVRQALAAIEERLKLPLVSGSPEYHAIQDAKSRITVLKANIPKMAFSW